MSLAKSPRQYMGVRAILPPDLQTAARSPTATDVAYVRGTLWLNTVAHSAWMFSGSGGWIELGSSSTGDIISLTGSSGGAITPVSGNITLAAGTGMLSTAGTAGTITFNVNFASPPALGSGTPAAVTGTTVSSTGAMTAGTGLTATTGNISSTAGQVNAGTSMTAGTTITATAGDITATLGHIVVNGAAKQFKCHGGAVTDFIGQATLISGTVDIANTNIAATDRIIVTRTAKNGSTAYGTPLITITASTKFNITACKSDTTTETNDASTFDYIIIRQV